MFVLKAVIGKLFVRPIIALNTQVVGGLRCLLSIILRLFRAETPTTAKRSEPLINLIEMKTVIFFRCSFRGLVFKN